MSHALHRRFTDALGDLALAYHAGRGAPVTRTVALGRAGKLTLSMRAGRDALTGTPDGVVVAGVATGDVLIWTAEEAATALTAAGLEIVTMESVGQRWTARCCVPAREEQSA